MMEINYLEDLINQLVEEAFELKKNDNPTEFEKGKLFGYYQTISTILNQAEAFGITNKISVKWRDFSLEELIH